MGSYQRAIPGGYTQVAVPVFSNKTSEVGVESYFTNAMIGELSRSHFARVTDKSDAQVVLEGEIDSIALERGASISAETKEEIKVSLPKGTSLTSSYRVMVVTKLQLRRLSDQKILWEGSFNGERTFSASQVATPVLNTVNPLYNSSARHETYKVLARDMMAEAHSRMTENF